MEKIYVALDDLWPYVQKEYEKAEKKANLEGMQWCNYFLQLISMADHKKVEVEECQN
jgi:hypothetical protein